MEIQKDLIKESKKDLLKMFEDIVLEQDRIRVKLERQLGITLKLLDDMHCTIFSINENLSTGDVLYIDGHKSKLSGFRRVDGIVKPVVMKFRKDGEGGFTDEFYSNEYVVQPGMIIGREKSGQDILEKQNL